MTPRNSQPPGLDNPPLRVQRNAQYTYSAPRRVVQRVVAFVQAVISAALGADISFWQSSADAQAAKDAGLKFIIIRALYGLSVDTKFAQHWKAFLGVMPRSAYLYYRDDQDAKGQAKKLFDTCQANGGLGELPPTLDVESINNPTLTASKIQLCAEELTKLFGKKPLIYTGFYVWRDEVDGDKDWAIAYELFIAGYPLKGWADDYPTKVLNYQPMIPAPFKMWTGDANENTAGKAVVWQWTSSAPAKAYGVSGNFLDLDHCSPAFAKKYLGTQPPPPVEPPPVGDPIVEFIVKGFMNIRSTPAVTPTNDLGDFFGGEKITAKKVIPVTPARVWVEFDENPTKYAALVYDGKTYLDPA